jgi:hypothetical protein
MGRARKCKFRKQNGDSCCADPQSGRDLCVFHDPARANDGQRASAFLLACLWATEKHNILASVSEGIFKACAEFHHTLSVAKDLFEPILGTLSLLPEEPVRAITLAFVQNILLLEATVSRISAERFGSHPILFSDSIEKLNEQLALVDQVLRYYNRLAREAHFAELSRDSICNSLTPLVDQEFSHIVRLAKVTMLTTLGEKTEISATINELSAICNAASATELPRPSPSELLASLNDLICPSGDGLSRLRVKRA